MCKSFLPKTHKCKSWKSRQELSNEHVVLFTTIPYVEYFLAKFGFDTAENEPLKYCPKIARKFEKKLRLNKASHHAVVQPFRADLDEVGLEAVLALPVDQGVPGLVLGHVLPRHLVGRESSAKIKWKIKCSCKLKLNALQSEN